MTFRTVLLPLVAVGLLGALPGCSGGSPAATPAAQSRPAFNFNVGKTWNYALTVTNPQGQSFVGDATLEFTQLDGSNAAFKLVGRIPTVPELSIDMKGDLNRNPYFAGDRMGETSVETVSVPAGSCCPASSTICSSVHGSAIAPGWLSSTSKGVSAATPASVAPY